MRYDDVVDKIEIEWKVANWSLIPFLYMMVLPEKQSYSNSSQT
jgi:hypothetical protein